MNYANWYWIVAGDDTKVWSSASAGFITATNPTYVAWAALGNRASRIASLDELRDVFAAQYPGGMLDAYAAAQRYAIETAGLDVGGATIDTSRDSQSMIANAYAYTQASGATSVTYKASSGWVTMSADQIKAVALAVGAHVQALFVKEKTIDDAITAGTITTRSAVDAAFAA